MTVCIDVGCAKHNNVDSLALLVERFKPKTIYGIDPLITDKEIRPSINGTRCIYVSAAAWTFDGWIGFVRDGSRSAVSESEDKVVALDLARFIDGLHDELIVLKIDAEGAEYELLPHLVDRGVDARLMLAWVEWHPIFDPDGSRRRTAERLFSPRIEEWHY